MRMCIVGDPEDLSAAYMTWLAQQRGYEVFELLEAQLGVDWSYYFDDLNPVQGHIEVAGQSFGLGDFDGAFVRLNPQPSLPPGIEADAGSPELLLLVMERRGAIQQFLNHAPFPVANRPCTGRSNGSKPFQMRRLSQAGFAIPLWSATNDLDAVWQFLSNISGGAVYKACSGLRSRVRMVDEQLLERLAAGTTPVVVQKYIAGTDVRVHTVNGKAFATKVQSLGTDYRFESEGNSFHPTEMPPRIEHLCLEFARQEKLILAGFDFRVSNDGTWYCLEVNPVPTFLPYEMATSQPIGDSILDLFADHHL